ncbi:diacylglycerol kinase family protein [Mechercharimyces sp. CAU 1602]|uniref:diacylglycerol/lipid kinase family protein n=1 Tax=Mechercharimyces sp. CAU 1602 TaxID=2973933 RepID=UPI002162BE10|nr:diacylglycerol kinase family protein [Mechercharimyces sp. CAU 1602]MCS1352684.1 diacylglycerol kinase family lipid kinase [Mechercharimyces sp. CAU 1602]
MYLFIINPVSGKGEAAQKWTWIEHVLKEQEIPYRGMFTQYAGHAQQLTIEWKDKPDVKAIIVIGGDGTVSEVGACLVGSAIPLGLIPSGSGNDFARTNHISMDPIRALKRMLSHQVKKIDTAAWQEGTMINSIGIGFDGMVTERANHSPLKKRIGKWVYVVATLQTLFRYQPSNVTIEVDESVHHYQRVWMTTICNSANFGGGMKICPRAKNDDGHLDLCIVHSLSPIGLLLFFPAVFLGYHVHHPAVSLLQGQKVKLSFDREQKAQADGEVLPHQPKKIEIVKESLLIL